MVGFGFVDNLIMVIAGNTIDKSLGIAFGFSAMFAADFTHYVNTKEIKWKYIRE